MALREMKPGKVELWMYGRTKYYKHAEFWVSPSPPSSSYAFRLPSSRQRTLETGRGAISTETETCCTIRKTLYCVSLRCLNAERWAVGIVVCIFHIELRKYLRIDDSGIDSQSSANNCIHLATPVAAATKLRFVNLGLSTLFYQSAISVAMPTV